MVVVHAWGEGSRGSLRSGVAAVSSWCRRGVLCWCRVAPFIWLPCHPVGDVAPVSGCEKRMEEGNRYLPERTRR